MPPHLRRNPSGVCGAASATVSPRPRPVHRGKSRKFCASRPPRTEINGSTVLAVPRAFWIKSLTPNGRPFHPTLLVLLAKRSTRDRPCAIRLVTELRTTDRVITHTCNSNHTFTPCAQVTSWLVNE